MKQNKEKERGPLEHHRFRQFQAVHHIFDRPFERAHSRALDVDELGSAHDHIALVLLSNLSHVLQPLARDGIADRGNVTEFRLHLADAVIPGLVQTRGMFQNLQSRMAQPRTDGFHGAILRKAIHHNDFLNQRQPIAHARQVLLHQGRSVSGRYNDANRKHTPLLFSEDGYPCATKS